MAKFYWKVQFKGENRKRVFKGQATTDKDVDTAVIFKALLEHIGNDHRSFGLTGIVASIRRAKNSRKV